MKIKITKNTPKETIEKIGSDCKRCGHCCKHSSGFLVKEDFKKIAKHLELTEEELKKNCLEEVQMFNTKRYRPRLIRNGKPYGTCIFFNTEEGCTIHGIKPFHCRIGTCSEHGESIAEWFTINYFVNPEDPESVREWTAQIRAGKKTIPGGRVEELIPDKIKRQKILKRELPNDKFSAAQKK